MTPAQSISPPRPSPRADGEQALLRESSPERRGADLSTEEEPMTAQPLAGELVAAEETPAFEAPVVSQAASIISVIERAALNPDVDIDKMERLLQMHERVMEREGRAAYFAALAEMQPKLPTIERRGTISVPAKDGKTGHNTPYALWEDVNEAIRPHLAEHGFALSFRVKKEQDRVEVTGVLSHRGGHSEETMLSLPMDTTGSKNNVQAIGSSVSYGKRYTAFALLNITSRGEDDDGKAAGAEGVVSDEQAAILRQLVTDTGTNIETFLAYAKAECIPDILASRFNSLKASLERKKGAAK